jgi:hypothetical protein
VGGGFGGFLIGVCLTESEDRVYISLGGRGMGLGYWDGAEIIEAELSCVSLYSQEGWLRSVPAPDVFLFMKHDFVLWICTKKNPDRNATEVEPSRHPLPHFEISCSPPARCCFSVPPQGFRVAKSSKSPPDSPFFQMTGYFLSNGILSTATIVQH